MDPKLDSGVRHVAESSLTGSSLSAVKMMKPEEQNFLPCNCQPNRVCRLDSILPMQLFLSASFLAHDLR
jgi:hypothetical protein